MNQDFVAWVGQGAIADRGEEHLATSDAGVVMLRKRLFDDLTAVAEGRDPRALIRDPARNHRVSLPIAARKALIEGMTRAQIAAHPVFKNQLAGYIFQAGQPPEVRAAYEQAMGLAPGAISFGQA